LNISKEQIIILLASFLLTIIDFNLSYWLVLEFAFLIFLVIDFKKTIAFAFPTGSIIAISFFVSNVFAISILQLLEGSNLTIGTPFYLMVPIAGYLPFAFIAAQLFFMGYQLVSKPQAQWLYFLHNIQNSIRLQDINLLIVIGFTASLLNLVHISAIDQVTHVLSNFTTCGFFAIALYKKSFTNKYLILGIMLQLFIVARSSMFGTFTVYVVFFAIMLLLLFRDKGFRLNWVAMLVMLFGGVVFLANLQNTKASYREGILAGTQDASLNNFISATADASLGKSITDKEYYLPIVYRLNQAWLISSTMIKVPYAEPFAGGGTIFRSCIDAIVPRFLNPDKEKAGGKEKIKKFTYLNLTENTSMNIGLLGEGYVNFGKWGAPIVIFLYGLLIGFLEKKILVYSFKKPIILLLFPVFFELVLTSETDFLIIINGMVKNTIIVLVVLYLMEDAKGKNKLQFS
jgi:hypothetical protein